MIIVDLVNATVLCTRLITNCLTIRFLSVEEVFASRLYFRFGLFSGLAWISTGRRVPVDNASESNLGLRQHGLACEWYWAGLIPTKMIVGKQQNLSQIISESRIFRPPERVFSTLQIVYLLEYYVMYTTLSMKEKSSIVGYRLLITFMPFVAVLEYCHSKILLDEWDASCFN